MISLHSVWPVHLPLLPLNMHGAVVDDEDDDVGAGVELGAGVVFAVLTAVVVPAVQHYAPID